jgi:CRP/FNR family transcriptional regulator
MKILTSSNHCSVCVYRKLIFGTLNNDELHRINAAKKEITFSKGELIHDENEPITSFMYLKEGLVKLHKKESQRRDQIINIALPQDFIGLINIFSENPFKFSITALENSTVCQIDLEVMKQIIAYNGQFALDILNKISDISNTINETRFQINSKHLRGRIAYILLMFAENIYHSETYDIPISRKEMAELINMTPENVIRILSEFKKEKIIDLDGKKITLMSSEKLDMICRLS